MTAAVSTAVDGVPPVPGAAGGRRLTYWLRLAPVLAALAVAVRVPSFLRPVWNPDEGFLAAQARLLAHGGVMYGTVVDRKPPLLPWIYQALFAVFGDTALWPQRVAATLALLATALLSASLARRRWGDGPGAAAGLTVLLLSVCLAPEDTQAAGFEVFILPWTVAALWYADRGRYARAGAAVAVAALTKQTGVAALAPALWLACGGWAGPGRWGTVRGAGRGAGRDTGQPGVAGRPGLVARRRAGRRPRPRGGGWAAPRWRGPERAVRCCQSPAARWAAIGWVAAGFAVPVAVVAVGTGPRRFAFWTVTGSASYVSPRGAWLTALSRADGNLSIIGTAAGALLLAAGAALVLRPRAVPGELWLWLAASLAAVTAGCQFFGHYFLQLVPPLALAAVAALRMLPRCRNAVAAWTVLMAAAFTGWGLAAPRHELAHARAVAAAVRAGTGPQQRVLVWGMHPEDYWLADRAPAARYLTAGFLTNFSGGRHGVRVGERYAIPGAWRIFVAEFTAHPPALVVDDSRGAPYAVDRTPTLRGLLETGYRRVATVDGAVVYARGPAS